MDKPTADIMLRVLRLEREDIFGPLDPQMPISEPADARLPAIGYVGARYRQGGTVLLGINPGGGGDSYPRTPLDAQLMPMITALRKDAAEPQMLAQMFDRYSESMRGWNLWRIVAPVLDAANEEPGTIAYLNWCPFRTRGDGMPHADAMRRAFEKSLAPLLTALRPQRVIALGMKVGGWLERVELGGVVSHVVPRTRGDQRVSDAALAALDVIRRSA